MEHTYNAALYHHVWDRDLAPTLEIQSGDVVHFDSLMAGDGQVVEGGSFADCSIDFDTVYNLCGPVAVAGANPGDTLEIEILEMKPGDWGWCAFLPGMGLLAEDFPDGYYRSFDLRNGTTAKLTDGVEIPITPFFGTMGNCPDKPGQHVPFPPHEGGGNMDTRHLMAGTTLYLPVLLPGAKFSIGDPHAMQGDGEVCVAALECPMTASLRFTLHRHSIPAPWFVTPPGPLAPGLDGAGYYATTGIADDLMDGAKAAVRNMIWLLGERHGLSREDAYMLCSLAGDLKIYEVVDMGMWNVGMVMPRSVFSN
jgi:acetamidase/formamidase